MFQNQLQKLLKQQIQINFIINFRKIKKQKWVENEKILSLNKLYAHLKVRVQVCSKD